MNEEGAGNPLPIAIAISTACVLGAWIALRVGRHLENRNNPIFPSLGNLFFARATFPHDPPIENSNPAVMVSPFRIRDFEHSLEALEILELRADLDTPENRQSLVDTMQHAEDIVWVLHQLNRQSIPLTQGRFEFLFRYTMRLAPESQFDRKGLIYCIAVMQILKQIGAPITLENEETLIHNIQFTQYLFQGLVGLQSHFPIFPKLKTQQVVNNLIQNMQHAEGFVA